MEHGTIQNRLPERENIAIGHGLRELRTGLMATPSRNWKDSNLSHDFCMSSASQIRRRFFGAYHINRAVLSWRPQDVFGVIWKASFRRD